MINIGYEKKTMNASIDKHRSIEKHNEIKNRSNLALLRRQPFGDFALLTKNIVFNFSNFKLITTE